MVRWIAHTLNLFVVTTEIMYIVKTKNIVTIV